MNAQNENHLPQALTDRNALWWRNLRMSLLNTSVLFSFFFFFVIIQSQFNNYYSFNHIPDEVILARALYTIPDLTNVYPQGINTPYYFSQYQLYPLYLRFFLKICIFDSWLSLPLASLFQNIVVTASFYYMLSTYNVVNNPLLATYIFSIYPYSFILQRNIALAGTLCFAFECLALAFLKKKKIFLVSICCFLAILSSFQGYVVSLSILTFLLFKKRIIFFLILLLATFSTIAILMFESYYMYNDKYAFIKAINDLFSNTPFESFDKLKNQRPLYFIFGIILSYFLPSIVGTIKIRLISLPHFLYCFYSLIFVLYFKKSDIEYYTTGLAAFSVIIGFDDFFSNLLKLIPSPIIFYFIEIIIYFFGAHFLKYHTMEQKYADFSMRLYSSFADL